VAPSAEAVWQAQNGRQIPCRSNGTCPGKVQGVGSRKDTQRKCYRKRELKFDFVIQCGKRTQGKAVAQLTAQEKGRLIDYK
jgi:hypothetical protein